MIGEQIHQVGNPCLFDYVSRQREWSELTFGVGKRTGGITKHIEKELEEIRKEPEDVMEWIDVVILAIDGYWRAGGRPELLYHLMTVKQDINMKRTYPKTSEDEASEHVRDGAE